MNSMTRFRAAGEQYSINTLMERNYEDDRDAETLRVVGDCADIARQLIEFVDNFPGSNGIEVAMGGGRRSFIPRVEGADPENNRQGERLDGRNLTDEWLNTLSNRVQHYSFDAWSNATTSTPR